jgi:hypothetical protein
MLHYGKMAAIHSFAPGRCVSLATGHNERASSIRTRKTYINLDHRPMTSQRTPATDSVNAVTRHRLLIGVVAALGALVAQAAGPTTLQLPMQPMKDYFREACFTLDVGQQLTYQLSTPHAIDFNLHHHQPDGGMGYPVKLVVKSKHSKQLVAESAEKAGPYCFMATNLQDQPGAFDVVINYEITAH